MASLLHNDSRRLYSWWWDSHISPKNSKWLQENLTDMDIKVKAMIKLIEEDADSFSRRAEMYYKKRPELMKMVEDFYRAYRSLAERYDHATGALRQAHRTMSEAFPNQIPLVLTDKSPSTSSDTDMEPHTPEMPAPISALIGPDDLHKDALDMLPHFHVIKRNGAFSEGNDALTSRKGLKQLNEMFSTGEGEAHSNSHEGRARKGLQFPEETGKVSDYKTHEFPRHLQIHESSEKEDIRKELEHLKEKLSQLSSENKNLKLQIASESEQAATAKIEVQSLKTSISKWNFEKETAIHEYQQSLQRISLLDTRISHTQDELKKLNDGMVMGAMKFRNAEERCLILEKANQSLQLELDKAEQKTKTQQQELNQKLEELERINILIKDEQQRCMEAELALSSVQKLHSQSQGELNLLALEHESGVSKLRDMELKNMSLEEEMHHLKEENSSLSEQYTSSILKIKDLQVEINVLKEIWGKFEDEMKLQIEENQVLLHELDSLKDEKKDLEQRHQSLAEGMEAVSLNADSLQALVKELQDENVKLKQICKKHEDEKLLLLEYQKSIEKISEKNLFLENSLEDSNVELEGLREKIKTFQGSCESLLGEVTTHITEKSMLVSQVETFAQNMEKIKEKNTVLENSQSDMNVELDGLRKRLKDLEEDCQTLHDEKANLLAEKTNLISQVESISWHLENLESRHAELEDKHSTLEREKNSTLEQLKELEGFLKLEKEQHETIILSSKAQLATLENKIHLLIEENQFWKENFEVEQQKIMSAHLEIFILQRCLCDIKEMNLILAKDCQKYLEAIELAEKLVSKFKQEDLIQRKEMMTLSWQNEKLVGGILMIFRVLNVGEFESTDGVKHESLLQVIFGEIEKMQNYISDAQDEILHLNLQITVIITLLKQIGSIVNDLRMEKVLLAEELVTKTEELQVLECKKQDLLGINKNMKQELQFRGQREEEMKVEMENLQVTHRKAQAEICNLLNENQFLSEKFYNLREEKDALAEENCIVLSEAMTLEHLFLLFKSFNAERLLELKLHCDNMKQDLQTKGHREEELKVEMETLQRHLSDSQEAHSKSKAEICKLLDKNQSLLDKFCNLREEMEALEEENCVALLEAMTLEHLFMLFKSFNAERMLELKLHFDNMKQDLQIKGQREEVLKVEMETLHWQLSDSQEAHRKLQAEICKLLDENQSLLKKFYNLKEEKDAWEAEHKVALSEAMSLEHLYMLYKSSNAERMLELKLHCDSMEQDLHIRGQREKKLKVEMETLHRQLSDLQDSQQESQDEICKLLDEKQSFSENFHNLREEKDALEEENSVALSEAIALEHLYMLYKSFTDERMFELKLHGDYMKQELQIRGQKEQELKVEMETLCLQLSYIQEAHQRSQAKIYKLIDENQSLSQKFCNLMEEKDTLEEENCVALSEAMTLEHLCMLFKSFNTERMLEVKLHSDNMDCLCTVISHLDREISEMNRKMSVLEVENMHLKESVASLEEHKNQLVFLEFDLNTAKYISEELNYQIETGKNLLGQREMELSEENQKTQTMQDRNRELSTSLLGLNQEIEGAKIVKEELEKRISSLSEDIAHRDEKIVHVSKENEMMYSELRKMNSIVEVLSRTEEYLTSIMQTGRGEIERCEVETMVVLNELHISTVFVTIFEEKVCELILLCESIEICAMLQREVLNEEITSRNAYINELMKEFNDLEGENRGLKDKMNTYLTSVMSLQDSVVSLEEQALYLAGSHSLGTQDKQDNSLLSHLKHENSSLLSEEPSGMIPVGVLELEKLIVKVKALTMVMTDRGSNLEQETLDATSDIGAARKEIDWVKQGSSGQEEHKINTDSIVHLKEEGEELGTVHKIHKKQKDDDNICNAKYEHMKDIQLDQASSSLPHGKGAGLYGLTTIESSETDDQMLELWEAAEMDCTQIQKTLPISLEHEMEAVEEEKSEYFSSELVAEKELSVDRFETPTEDMESHQEQRRKVNEKLASDAQRLAALRISIQELKRKMGDLENRKHARCSEHETVKTKLKDAEESLSELIDTNCKLTKNVEDYPTYSFSRVQGSGSTGRNQISERARKMSEKIGSFELELQKLQYILLKVEEKHGNNKTRTADRRSKVPLRDYLNGKRIGVKQKKGFFCGCMKPKTNVD